MRIVYTYPKDYLPEVLRRFEGSELYSYSPMNYTYKQENIAITSEGVADDGQASIENWWFWKYGEKDKPFQIMGLEEHPIENVKIINCKVNDIKKENVIE